MKEWLKEFVYRYQNWEDSVEDRRNISANEQFISDYLRDHPLPLPTDNEIKDEGLRRRTLEHTGFVYTHDVKWFTKGANWMKSKMEGNI